MAARAMLRRPAIQLAVANAAAASSRWSGLTTTTTTITRTTMPTARAPPFWAGSSRRGYAQISRDKINRAMSHQQKLGERGATREQTMSQMQKAAAMDIFKDGGGPLFPGTFVPIPFSQRPKNPLQLARYQWWRLRSYAQCVLSVLTIKLRSMPSWTTRPQWKARRARIAPTARAMYREALEAFAAGDKATVARLCMPRFATQLHAAMDRRSPRETVRFEHVKDTRRLVYPRLVSHLIHAINPHDKTALTEQAVVAVSSQQQLSRHNKEDGRVVPGSLRVQDKVEYVVLARAMDTKTYPDTPWRIWGTTGGTTPEAYKQEQAVIRKESAHRAGWKEKA
ncbi:Membrane transporter, Tim44-related/Ribosomal protein L45 [Cordyceps fumosorosea ARSEF 2679]|uniref:Large ribosomal subunit protein mL45 n=1 Tax=Cordyceps fumosorosea (strain ARSEF 2679) TaxID=1081104 RepID=A0A167T180_CORFA|nr:Membrane transporter, Tim44-related/Ribosomal protein L45 [Cordyceps fumosorosea ARSEF 2679]OAA60142.1 Membrane transporter, Tim44-related/Ribosomal protein L45 [Cordyceps fumosorosea ARSEF 2679]